MRFASYVPTTARPALPTMATVIGAHVPAKTPVPGAKTRAATERPSPRLTVEEFVQLARSAGAL